MFIQISLNSVVRGEQSRYEYAALCQYVIVFLESIIEPLILLMKKTSSHTSTQLCYYFNANIILNMLNLTFLYGTCGKTEIQFIQVCEDTCCVYSE